MDPNVTARLPRASAGASEATRLLEEVDRVLAGVRRDVERVLAPTHPSAERLHRLHRGLRRLRTGLEVGRELFPPADRAHLPGLDRRVRRLARLVGAVRDRDVHLALLEGVETHARTGSETEMLHRHRTRLRDDARTGREVLRAFARAEAQSGLFNEVQAAIDRARRPARARPVTRFLSDHHARGLEALTSARRRARRRPSLKRLHRLRVRVRQLRQFADFARAVRPRGATRYVTPFHHLQQELGRVHDLDVLIAGLDPTSRETRWARALRAERKARRRDVRRALRASAASGDHRARRA